VNFRSLLLRRAARQYARRLPGVLLRGYGAGEFYTAAQIDAAVRQAGLPPRYVAIGYAAYLPGDAFSRFAPADDYQTLRILFKRYVRRSAAWGFEPAPESAPPGIGF
jgi:hypothetical protein